MYRIPDQRKVIIPTAIVWLLITFLGVCSLKIEQLTVPSFVSLSSNDSVIILDCDYKYDEKEKTNLVVKWFRELGPRNNKTSHQVYQWIPSYQPQSLGILKDRVDIQFEASDDPFTKYRAVKIIKPSLNISGEYKCHVSSNYQDDEKSLPMVIYSPAKKVSIDESSPSVQKVNITCRAEGIYPAPTAELGITKGNKKTRTPVKDATQSIFEGDDGLFNIVIYKEFEKKHLSSETFFDCNVSVPETEYSAYKSFTYYPGSHVIDENGKSVSSPKSTAANGMPESSISEPSLTQSAVTTTPLLASLFLVIVRFLCQLLV